MGFYETPLRRYFILRAVLFLVIAGAVIFILWTQKTTPEGDLFAFAILGGALIACAYYIWRAKDAGPEELVYATPDHAPVPEQIRQYKVWLWISIVVFPVFSLWIAYDLNRLMAGTVESVRVWAPIAHIHNNFGYWPAVLTMPAFAFLCIVSYIKKLRALSSRLPK